MPDFTLHHGNCLDILKTLPPDSIDSIVTDPPYGLKFMGKRWDYDVPSVEVWAECLRVLKPGGHLLAFAGTRTQHRMAVRIEDAGFEIRDMIAWVYGCLSEDSEVLTRNGWEHYHTAKRSDILTYDPEADIYQWERPSRWSEYRVQSDTAYRIESDHTDQIVSRGHRCLVERGGKLTFVSADELSRMERVPYLQNGVSPLSQGTCELLLSDMLRKGENMAETALGQRQREETTRHGSDRGQKSGMERWSDPFQTKGQVRESGDQICAVPPEHDGHGPQGRVRDGASAVGCAGYWQGADARGVRSPHQPRRDGQPAGELDAVCHQRGPQTIRTRASYKTSLATVTPVEYTGLIFCPTVTTGAFVARRNGKVFLTGNSGFPKSLDVSKAIDKAAGAEREVVGSKLGMPGYSAKTADEGNCYGDGLSNGEAKCAITSPATDASRQWQGWGTALKPALETVTFASKPYTDEQERDIIQSNLIRLEARLWLMSCASAVEKNFTSNPSEYAAACAIAQWGADEITSTQAALCGQMDTSRFESATTTSLSIVSSWRRTLAESLSDGSTSTIETKSSMTIDWRTLKFSLSQITPSTIIKACSLPGGFSANASTAESHFNALLSLLQSILTLSAIEPAISLAQHEHLGAGVKPNLDPCIMARKPLDGTVAENVLTHGTGAINVDGCRVAGESTRRTNTAEMGYHGGNLASEYQTGSDAGRWPANLIHDGSEEVMEAFPQAPGQIAKAAEGGDRRKDQNVYGTMTRGSNGSEPRQDAGSAARFFYCAKASKSDRESGLDSIERVLVYCDAWESAGQPATLLVDTAQSVPRVIAVSGAPNNDVHEWNTLLFGSEQTAQSLTECRSTIETVTSSTTVSKTLNWLTRSLTSACTAGVKSEMANGGSHAGSAAIGSPSAIITSDLTVSARGVERAPSKMRWSIKGNAGSPAIHPTVKPTNLMRYLCRLVTPVHGVVLDPFMGSGSTGKAAMIEGCKFIGIEMDQAFVEIARGRISSATTETP